MQAGYIYCLALHYKICFFSEEFQYNHINFAKVLLKLRTNRSLQFCLLSFLSSLSTMYFGECAHTLHFHNDPHSTQLAMVHCILRFDGNVGSVYVYARICIRDYGENNLWTWRPNSSLMSTLRIEPAT